MLTLRESLWWLGTAAVGSILGRYFLSEAIDPSITYLLAMFLHEADFWWLLVLKAVVLVPFLVTLNCCGRFGFSTDELSDASFPPPLLDAQPVESSFGADNVVSVQSTPSTSREERPPNRKQRRAIEREKKADALRSQSHNALLTEHLLTIQGHTDQAKDSTRTTGDLASSLSPMDNSTTASPNVSPPEVEKKGETIEENKNGGKKDEDKETIVAENENGKDIEIEDSGRTTGGISPSQSSMDNSATTIPNGTMVDAKSMYEFEIPNSLVGLIIGVKGKTIKELASRTKVSMLIRQHDDTAKVDTHQICEVRGEREKIDRCLHMLRRRFPVGRFPELNLQPVLPSALPTCLDDLLNAYISGPATARSSSNAEQSTAAAEETNDIDHL